MPFERSRLPLEGTTNQYLVQIDILSCFPYVPLSQHEIRATPRLPSRLELPLSADHCYSTPGTLPYILTETEQNRIESFLA